DVAGMDALIEATLHQNGELTVMVQSTEKFAFDGTPTTEGPEGALVHYLRGQGVRVVFAGKAGETPSAARVDSNAKVTATGSAVRIFEGPDPRVREMWDRLDLLREAQRTVKESPKYGAEALGMKDKSAAELDIALQKEIDALLQHARDLRDVAGRDLLIARGEAGEVDKYQEPARN